MPSDINFGLFKKTIDSFVEETIIDVKGSYLDKGTSLTETLAEVSAEEASRSTIEGGTTVAGHTAHVRFYFDVLRRYMDGTLKEKIDWKKSWLVTEVNESEWDKLRKNLADDYNDIQTRLGGIENWNDERNLGGAMAIIAHTAFHLGAIRQILRVVK